MLYRRSTILGFLILSSALAACSGGGGAVAPGTDHEPPTNIDDQETPTPEPEPPTEPPTPEPEPPTEATGPASTGISDLIAFADLGTRTKENFQDNTANGWWRSSRCDGDVCVTVDRIPGAEGAGLVVYQKGEDVFIYDVFGSHLSTMEVPSGNYKGELTANYRIGTDGEWFATVGEMKLLLNMAGKGALFLVGSLPYGSTDGPATGSIQFIGKADIVDGEFTDKSVSVSLDAGDASFFATATTSGFLVTGDGGAAVLGTIYADNPTALQLEGVYMAPHDPRP